jgi:hypothetical protein
VYQTRPCRSNAVVPYRRRVAQWLTVRENADAERRGDDDTDDDDDDDDDDDAYEEEDEDDRDERDDGGDATRAAPSPSASSILGAGPCDVMLLTLLTGVSVLMFTLYSSSIHTLSSLYPLFVLYSSSIHPQNAVKMQSKCSENTVKMQ